MADKVKNPQINACPGEINQSGKLKGVRL